MREVAAVILAAGRASRFRAQAEIATKLVANFEGMPMVRRVALTALAAKVSEVIVVTGHAHQEVEHALEGLPIRLVHNAGFASGLAGSLQTSLDAVSARCDGALVMLGDMPGVKSATCDRLVEAFSASFPWKAVLPQHGGNIGNPVLLARDMFGEVTKLTGDAGARRLLAASDVGVLVLPVDDPGVLADVDTPAALEALRQHSR